MYMDKKATLERDELSKVSVISRRIRNLSERFGITPITGSRDVHGKRVVKLEVPAPYLKHYGDYVEDDTAIVEIPEFNMIEFVEMLVLAQGFNQEDIIELLDRVKELNDKDIEHRDTILNPYVDELQFEEDDIDKFDSVEELIEEKKNSILTDCQFVSNKKDPNFHAMIRVVNDRIFAIAPYETEKYIVVEQDEKDLYAWNKSSKIYFNDFWVDAVSKFSVEQLEQLAIRSERSYNHVISKMKII